MNSRLDGSVCVVAGIGGAIGTAVADRFSAEGATVVGIDRRDFECAYPVIRADLISDVETEAAFERIHHEYGLIDVLYVNAGPINLNDHGVLETSSTVWGDVMTGVLSPAVNACRYGVPHLQREGRGSSVILTGSFLAGMGAATAQMAFSAAKAAVTQLGRDLGVHLARSGVRVNTLALGPVLTPELEAMFERVGPEGAQRRFTHMPMSRFATLDEVAAAAAFLASADSGFITASVLPVDGGITSAYTVADT
jgi:NAD(P)-dependent dehydrogenase (short-subunit alcohol dehydrogenase family)